MSATDELRAMAESVGLAMPQAATLMMEAADTIDHLDTENAKLRDELAKWERLMANIELPEYPVVQFKPKDLERENAKLRELVLALSDCRNTTCDDCVRWDYPEGGCTLDGVMRELRIEVNK